MLATHALLSAGITDRVCWVVPRDSLRLQAVEAFADPAWRATLATPLPSVPPTTRRLRETVQPAKGNGAAPPAEGGTGWTVQPRRRSPDG